MEYALPKLDGDALLHSDTTILFLQPEEIGIQHETSVSTRAEPRHEPTKSMVTQHEDCMILELYLGIRMKANQPCSYKRSQSAYRNSLSNA